LISKIVKEKRDKLIAFIVVVLIVLIFIFAVVFSDISGDIVGHGSSEVGGSEDFVLSGSVPDFKGGNLIFDGRYDCAEYDPIDLWRKDQIEKSTIPLRERIWVCYERTGIGEEPFKVKR
jgi:hypothetical protein